MRIPSRTLWKSIVVVALAFGCLTGGACGSDEAVQAERPDTYHVTQERNGDTIQLAVGQPLAVVLPSIAGSSSRWAPEGLDTSILRPASGTQTVGGRHGGMIIGGSKAYEKLIFQALRSGATRLRLTRVRTPREGGGKVAFEIGVVVGGGSRVR